LQIVRPTGHLTSVPANSNMSAMRFECEWNPTCGLSAVRKGGLWGYIDTKRRLVIELRYDWVTFFHRDAAMVCLAGRVLFIDTEGREIPEHAVVQRRLRQQPWRGVPRPRRSAVSEREYTRISPLSVPRNFSGHKK
jgi:hypothetical protein